MARDIEEFLRQAAARRQKQASSPPPATPKPAKPTQRLARDDDIYVIEAEEAKQAKDMRSQTVGRHVQTHIDTSRIAEQVSHLGEEVGYADEKLESRLHKKFDHKLGDLQIDPRRSAQSETTSVTVGDISGLARDLVSMLRTPTSVRQAIIISEVLKRPDLD